MTTNTCRCGAPTNVGCVDLCEFLCNDCWMDFDDWANENRGTPFAEWPGRVA